MEGRAREHVAVHQSNGQANVHALRQRFQHPARARAVHVEGLARPRVEGGNHERLAVLSKAYVTEESLIQDRMDLRLVVYGALAQTADFRTLCRGVGVHGRHDR